MTENRRLDASNENLRDLTRAVNQHVTAKEMASKQSLGGNYEVTQNQSQTMQELLSVLQKDPSLIDIFDASKS